MNRLYVPAHIPAGDDELAAQDAQPAPPLPRPLLPHTGVQERLYTAVPNPN